MRRLLSVTVALTVALLAGTRVAAQPAPADAFAGAAAAIRSEMAKAGIPGAAVAVVVGDRVVWSQGFGLANVETATPVTADTLFQIGSVTKSVTAAAVLAAARDGAVALDRPVSTYVSGLVPCVGQPTLRQLLSHTAGLIDEPAEFGPQGEDGLAAYPRTWTSEYCLLAPGRAFSYSNSGFALAGLALQEAAKTPFADAVRARLLAPLGMTRTTFRPTEAMTWPLAVGHRRAMDGTFEVLRPLANDARLWPAGTLYSSANEMARFVLALMNDGRVEGRQVLPAGVAAAMSSTVARVPATGQAYGQGLFLSGDDLRVGHGGAMTGYAAEFDIEDWRRIPGGGMRGRELPIGIVVMTNADGANPRPLLRAALTGTPYDLITFGDGGPLPERVLTEREADRFVGRYANPRRFTVEVVREGASLVLKRFGRTFPMRAFRPGDTRPGIPADQFVVDLPNGGTEAITFGIGPDGRADYLHMNVWALARVPNAPSPRRR